MKIAIMALALSTLALGCGGGDDGGADPMSGDGPNVPESVVEMVRDEHPQTRTDDIAYSYNDIKEQDPSASDEEAAQWIVEVLDQNLETDAWNECLERDPTGSGCDEPSGDGISDENPIGW